MPWETSEPACRVILGGDSRGMQYVVGYHDACSVGGPL